jgi:hypothetical protein
LSRKPKQENPKILQINVENLVTMTSDKIMHLHSSERDPNTQPKTVQNATASIKLMSESILDSENSPDRLGT